MRYRIAPLFCRPWTLNGITPALIESHYEHNYGGALNRLNAIAEELAALDPAATPGHVINRLKQEEMAALNSTLLHELYFASLGITMPAIQVAIAGTIEIISSIGLTLGLFTRPVALLGSVYLLMSMLWGGHFHIGYVWALPEGGYEFGVFWAVIIGVFAVLGGGRYSVDRELWRSKPARSRLPCVVWKVLAT